MKSKYVEFFYTVYNSLRLNYSLGSKWQEIDSKYYKIKYSQLNYLSIVSSEH